MSAQLPPLPVAVSVAAFVATPPVAVTRDAASSLEDDMQAYIDANGFAERERRGEIAVLSGTAIVDVVSTHPQWVAHRTLAYEQALLGAQSDYVLRQRSDIVAKTVSDTFKAAGQEPPPYQAADNDPSKPAEVLRKLQALGIGAVDKALRDLNINPADSERLAPPQRYVQLQQALTQKAMITGFNELVGLMPVQTFEKQNGGDSTKIGVIAIVSPKMKDFAQRVLTERGQFPPDIAHAGNLSALTADKTDLTRQFGVRWRYDQDGLPVIVSFSQWMSDYRGQDPISAERYKDVAFRQAELRADAQIADFLKGSANVSKSAETGQEMTEAAERMPDGYVKQLPEVRSLINAYQASIRRESRVQITGLTTLSRWTAKHPDTGQPIIGVVRIWSAASEKSARALRDGTAAKPVEATASVAAPSGPAPTRTGRALMDATDF